MLDNVSPMDMVPLQDVDLLQRLNQYFTNFDHRLRQGQGWLIFNASGPRAGRITGYLQHHLQNVEIPFSHYFLPWRDFALTSYLVQVELREAPEWDQAQDDTSRREYQIATRVSRQTLARMMTSDLLILNGLTPRHDHEVQYLEETIERRYRTRLATILITPEQPHELALDVSRLSGQGLETWTRISTRLYETSLVAV
jgi:hypothetical protein